MSCGFKILYWKSQKIFHQEKLPMVLFHEGLTNVVSSKHPDFEKRGWTVIIPSISGYVLDNTDREKCCNHYSSNGNSNYCERGVFLGSGYDRLAQSKLVISGLNLVKSSLGLADEVAVLSELISVSLNTILFNFSIIFFILKFY